MSGSEMGNTDQIPHGFQNLQLSDATAPPTVAAAVPAAVPAPQVQGQLTGSSSEPVKRKRGRPRKYGPGAANLSSPSSAPPSSTPSQPQFSPVAPPPGILSPPAFKKGRGRGRPRGSRNKTTSKRTKTGAGSRGRNCITPHTMIVKPGEDLSSRIVSLSESGPRNVFVMSANGPISNVSLHRPAATEENVAYEGRYEILTLNGSFVHHENGGHLSTRGGLSVALSGPDGRLFGGGVIGRMIAAAPVQLVLGSFPLEEGSGSKVEAAASAPSSMAEQSSSTSEGSVSESSDDSDGPLDQSAEINENTPQGVSSMPWN